MKVIKEKLTALKKVSKVINSNKELLSDIDGLSVRAIDCEIVKLEKSVDFNINIKGHSSGNDWFNCLPYNHSYNINIGLFGDNYNRTISWSDDDRQPIKSGEWLYMISFPTGAYIFGDSYPTKTFNLFFNELKGYKPKYTDTSNKALYFTKDIASKVHNDFNGIFNKYKELVSDEFKAKKIQQMKSELEKLENE